MNIKRLLTVTAAFAPLSPPDPPTSRDKGGGKIPRRGHLDGVVHLGTIAKIGLIPCKSEIGRIL